MTSSRRRSIAKFVIDFREEHGISPTFREVAEHEQIALSNVQWHIDRMHEEGLLRKPKIPGAHPTMPRSLVPTEAAMKIVEEHL